MWHESGPEIVKRLSPPNIRDICVIILVGFDRRMRPLQDLCSFNGVLGGDFDLGNVFLAGFLSGWFCKCIDEFSISVAFVFFTYAHGTQVWTTELNINRNHTRCVSSTVTFGDNSAHRFVAFSLVFGFLYNNRWPHPNLVCTPLDAFGAWQHRNGARVVHIILNTKIGFQSGDVPAEPHLASPTFTHFISSSVWILRHACSLLILGIAQRPVGPSVDLCGTAELSYIGASSEIELSDKLYIKTKTLSDN